jgi:23S rRNA (guanine745-N1)-methyltransferase|tara:strand:+ start:5274 stop:5996 length:723 start_codon:yes stop_codon:yes gene_type:complete
LHLAQKKRSKNPGDNDLMVKSRQRFLNAGYYCVLADSIASMLLNNHSGSLQKILDIGCGEGYYLEKLSTIANQDKTPIELIGVDIAKNGVRQAAKRKFKAQLVVDSAYQLPLFSDSIDTALSVFSPLCPIETARVLRPGGTLLMVGPGEEHLTGLTQHVYQKHQPHEGNFRNINEHPTFELQEEVEIKANITVDGTHTLDLLTMTPYYWHTSPEQQKAISDLKQLETQIHFYIRVYQNNL